MSHDPSTRRRRPRKQSVAARERHGRGRRRTRMQHGHRPGRLRADPCDAGAREGLAFPASVLPGRSRAARLDLDRATGSRASTTFGGSWATSPRAPEQLQCFAVPGHKADFGIVMAGPDLRAIHDVQMALQASSLGPALHPSLFVLLDHRGLRVRPRRRAVRQDPPRARGASTPRAASSRPRSPPTPSGSAR